MGKAFDIPPKNPQDVIPTKDLALCLNSLIGKSVKLTGKPRTDGSTLRKIVTDCISVYSTCEGAKENEYEIIPPRRKGIPRLLRELIDTYIVTSGINYNLQVWNRFPNSKFALVEYKNGKKIRACDIRLVFLKINLQKSIIETIVILSPSYIEKKFGQFGKPTIKHQIIISEKKRTKIKNNVLLGSDTKRMASICRKTYKQPTEKVTDFPKKDKPFCIELLSNLITKRLLGTKLLSSNTKNKGQVLERMIMELLGYESNLVGDYPDIPNQLLEVKVQDSPTIDLGKYSPEFEEVICSNITTKDIRYLIALTNPKSNTIESVVLVSGEEIGNFFSFVSNTSFKCQRSIPMAFFEKYKRKAVFNP